MNFVKICQAILCHCMKGKNWKWIVAWKKNLEKCIFAHKIIDVKNWKTGWNILEGFLSTKLLDNVVFQLRFFLCSLIKAKKSQIKIICKMFWASKCPISEWFQNRPPARYQKSRLQWNDEIWNTPKSKCPRIQFADR